MRWCLVLVALLAASLAHSAPGLAGRKPNIIFILTDDQGYGDLSCHGNPVLKTPDVDRLHDEAVRNARWSLVSDAGGREPAWQLFDLKSDYAQAHDLTAQRPEVVKDLAAAYERWWASVQPQLVNEHAVGLKIKPFKELYWQQFGGGPSAQLRGEMHPTR